MQQMRSVTKKGAGKMIADTVNKQIHDILKTMIVDGKIKPGGRIDPKLIASEYVSRLMPVRNALQQLTVEGLVRTVQRVGFFVRRFSNAELQQINDMRKMFELYCIDKYFDNINKSEARQIMDRLSTLPLDNSNAIQLLDTRLHRMIVGASNNEFIMKNYDSLNCFFSLSRGPLSAEVPDVEKEEHLAILDAICSDDPDRAYRALVEHLDRVGQELVTQNVFLGGNGEDE